MDINQKKPVKWYESFLLTVGVGLLMTLFGVVVVRLPIYTLFAVFFGLVWLCVHMGMNE